jgi:LuxR family quorum sensing-dependent transcriptional regulator
MSQFDHILALIGQLRQATTAAEICERLLSFMAGLHPAAVLHDGVSGPAVPWNEHVRHAPRRDRPERNGRGRLGRDSATNGTAPPRGLVPWHVVAPPVRLDGSTRTVSLGDEAAELSSVEFGMVTLAASCAIGRAMQLQGKRARRTDPTDLTPRERECLQWAAIGKSEWEISRILGISEHTSEKHLLNAKTKLGAANRVQAVAEAIRRGYIN